MIKEFFAFINKLVDKYGNVLLLAFVAGIATLTLGNRKWVSLLPFGKNNIYWALAVLIAIYILIFNFVRFLYNKHQYRQSMKQVMLSNMRQDQEEDLAQLWDTVDSFSEEEREDLRKFVATNNQPIPKYKSGNLSSLYNSELVVSIEKRTTREDLENDEFAPIYTHMYKLKEPIFNALKYSMQKYGRIGNFEE